MTEGFVCSAPASVQVSLQNSTSEILGIRYNFFDLAVLNAKTLDLNLH